MEPDMWSPPWEVLLVMYSMVFIKITSPINNGGGINPYIVHIESIILHCFSQCKNLENVLIEFYFGV